MDKWDGIETIIADGIYDLSIQEELDSFKVFQVGGLFDAYEKTMFII